MITRVFLISALTWAGAACAPLDPEPTPGDGGLAPPPPASGAFSYRAPGDLEPRSGQGVTDRTVYAPDIVFPITDAAAFINSQVYRPGGAVAGGDQCSGVNFSYPWRDTFCERRPGADRDTLNCPSRAVHQGVDIRAGDVGTCRRMRDLVLEDPAQNRLIPVRAVKDGQITHVGRFSVTLRSGGQIFRYLHLNMAALPVAAGDTVRAGDVIGYLSNDFGGTPTTFHLHLEFIFNFADGSTWASPYMSLVRAYERANGVDGREVF